jgi:hypothetical protein
MGAYGDMTAGFAGLPYGFDRAFETWKAAEAINFGDAIFGYVADPLSGYKFKMDESAIVLDADLIASNVLTITLTKNGVAQTAVTVTYASAHLTTMNAMKTAIEAAFPGLTATVGGSGNRTITLFWKGVDLAGTTSAVTLGSTQAGVVVTAGTQQVFVGIAAYTAKTERTGTEQYALYDAMNVLTRGRIYVTARAAVSAGNAAKVLTSGANKGSFGTTGYDAGCFYRSNAADGAIVELEVRGLKIDTAV